MSRSALCLGEGKIDLMTERSGEVATLSQNNNEECYNPSNLTYTNDGYHHFTFQPNVALQQHCDIKISAQDQTINSITIQPLSKGTISIPFQEI